MESSRRWLAIVLMLLGAASYGLLSTVIKLAMADGWSVSSLTLQQVVFGAIMLWLVLGVARIRARRLARRRGIAREGRIVGNWRNAVGMIVIGVIGMSLTTIFYNEALARLDASLAIVLLFQFTWITILLESIRKREWPTRPQWAAVGFIAIGTVLAVGLLEHELGQLDGQGVLYGLLSAVSYSLFFFLSGFLPANLDPLAKSAMMSTASLAFVVAMQAPLSLAAVGFSGSLMGWGALLGFLGTAFPFFCFNYGIPKVGSGLAALLGAMELPAAVIAAFAILNEPLTAWQGFGIVLIIAGIVAAQRKTEDTGTAGKVGEGSL
ncbi:DMT family transporter [Cohnella endophytica]|uniref:DMT family transporter n=1 Tax=Cohnella endophytica TaxID=2419778 RepID=A0A494XEA5_9BACL|nr:DMT family transporter [Cohnella endophytica]RKP48970.1 DMT family transporter [Cohnella endophytica]